MNACRPLELCAFLQGELEPLREVALEEHLVRCSKCAEELAWLRAERRLFALRARGDRGALPSFESVMARPVRRLDSTEARPPEERRSWRSARVALGICAAAALVALLGPGRGAGERGGGRRGGDNAIPPANTTPPTIVAEPLQSVPERPRATCLEASSPDEITCSTDGAEVSLEGASTPLVRRSGDIEDEYGACLIATPASRAPRTLTCDAPPL